MIKVVPTFASLEKPQLASLIARMQTIDSNSTVEERINLLLSAATILQPPPNSDQKFDQNKQDFFINIANALQLKAPNPPESAKQSSNIVEINHLTKEAEKADRDLQRKSILGAESMKNRTHVRVALRVLSKMSIFQDCSKTHIKALVDQMVRRKYSEGDAMCNEGRIEDEFICVCTGQAVVIKDGERIATLKAKDFAGERVLVSETGTTQRGASIIAIEDTVVMVMKKDAMDHADVDAKTKEQIFKRAQTRMQELLLKDATRLKLKNKNKGNVHQVEFLSQFMHPPIGLVLEGKNDVLRVKGFEGEGNIIPNVQLGDQLAGVNGVVFKKMTHEKKMEEISKQHWPLTLLFRRTVDGAGPPAPSSVSMQFPVFKEEDKHVVDVNSGGDSDIEEIDEEEEVTGNGGQKKGRPQVIKKDAVREGQAVTGNLEDSGQIIGRETMN